MALEELKVNVLEEENLASKIIDLSTQIQSLTNPKEKENMAKAIDSISERLKIINNSIPELLGGISMIKKIPEENPPASQPNLVSLQYRAGGVDNMVVIQKNDKGSYLKQLRISEDALKDIKKKKVKVEEFHNEFKEPRKFVAYANKLFLKNSKSLMDKGYFNSLKLSLRRTNLKILPYSYVSVMLLVSLIAFVIGILLTFFLILFNITFEAPFISLNTDILGKMLMVIWIIPLAPIITFAIAYFYPSAEKSSLGSGIDDELPFVVIQMSAIAGSEIEPSNIFKIIALSKEYPNIRQEAKKMMNQINLYGYDLITALKNISISSPSEKWAELLNGFSTTIRSGGDLSKYLDKKAESLLFEYRLNREKATKAAETFMNIYISVVIAAPMLLMLVLIMLNVSGLGFQMPIPILSLIVVSIVALINIIFLVYLQISQKKV
jgi:flagellar protein FlaJ